MIDEGDYIVQCHPFETLQSKIGSHYHNITVVPSSASVSQCSTRPTETLPQSAA